MSSVALTLERADEMTMSAPYMNEIFAFIVKDYRREEFSSRASVRRQTKLKLGIVNAPYYVASARVSAAGRAPIAGLSSRVPYAHW